MFLTMKRWLREYIHKMRKRKLVVIFMILLSLQLPSGIWHVAEDKESYERRESEYKLGSSAKESHIYTTEKAGGNARRFHNLKNACRQLGYVENENSTNIRAHISPNLKLLYCRVNKCASTMTLELLKRMFDCDTECLIKVAERVRSNVNAREIMNDAFSFMVVREPYGRLFSTYCNIFYFPKEDWLYRGSKIIKFTRSNISYDSMTYGHDLTFAELVKYTVEAYETGNHLDEHVRPMHHKSCNPCVFKFDYIAHLETLQSDFNFIFDKLDDTDVKEIYPREIMLSLKNWTIFGPINHLFRTIPLLKGSNIHLYSVYLRAWCYYQITGHILKNIDFPYNKTLDFYITKEAFLQNIKKAMEVSAINKTELKLQRTEAMMQAYSTISSEYLERLSKVVRNDCLLFGYEERPSYLFDKNKCTDKCSHYNYFKGV